MADIVIIDRVPQSTSVVVQPEVTTRIVEGIQGPPGPIGPAGGVGPIGPRGEQGPPGEGYSSYLHNQIAASDVWDITHGLDRYPNVVIMDSAGNEVYGDVQHVNATRVVLMFSAPFSGTAHLS